MRNKEGKRHGVCRSVFNEEEEGIPKGTITEATYKNGSIHGLNIQITKAALVVVFFNDSGTLYGDIEFFLPSFKLKTRTDEGTGMIDEFEPEHFQP